MKIALRDGPSKTQGLLRASGLSYRKDYKNTDSTEERVLERHEVRSFRIGKTEKIDNLNSRVATVLREGLGRSTRLLSSFACSWSINE